jgi:hypothetical protein
MFEAYGSKHPHPDSLCTITPFPGIYEVDKPGTIRKPK